MKRDDGREEKGMGREETGEISEKLIEERKDKRSERSGKRGRREKRERR